MLVLGVDPGEKRTGVAWLLKTEQGQLVPLKVMVYKDEDFNRFLDKLPQQHVALDPEGQYRPLVVCEDFIARPKFDGLWLKLPTAERIGAIKRECYRLGWPFFKQQPSCLKIGCKLMSIDYNPKKHLEDRFSALAHAAYFATNGGRRT